MITAFTTGIGTIQTDVLTVLTAIIPIALALFGILFVIKYGKRALQVIAGSR